METTIMRKLFIAPALIAFGTLALAATGAGAAPAAHPVKPAYVGAELAPQAKVTMAAARATALQARPGKIIDAELEKEAGGTGLRYSFDIASNGKPYEVGVDAGTGKILENKVEGKNPD